MTQAGGPAPQCSFTPPLPPAFPSPRLPAIWRASRLWHSAPPTVAQNWASSSGMAARAGGAKEWGQLAGGGGLSVQGSSTRPASGPQLRLIWSEDDLCGPPQFDDPRKAWTLAEFFERWFLPGKLKPKHRAQGTINLYRDAIRYWEMITGDPPLGLIGDEHGIEFVGQLPECGYTRAGGRRGGHQRIGLRDGSPALMPLSSTTIAQHVSRVAGLLQAAGPRYHIRKASAEILGRCPFVPEYAGQFEAKEPWSLGEVRQITRGCSSMVRPELPAWLPHELWWQTRLALFYFTGMRAGTICALARAHIHDSAGELWLESFDQLGIPGPGRVAGQGEEDDA